ncbi:MAG TPA: BlaI/MecI/CopY family transcriptional regulator [Pyrinomonadaceae bacterium]|nr:BlaI/MecI/CopY family transcriptional regulator [Pyrinomonadaceae bacterium]
MARKPSPTLTEAELRVMNVLWERGASTVNDVLASLNESLSLSYSTVLTTLRILEQKGYIEHTKNGRAFLYTPLVNCSGARRSALQHILDRFFDNSPELLVLNVMEQEGLNVADLQRLKLMLEENKEEGQRGGA